MTIPAAARRILRDGTLCYVSAPAASGPHLTPVVFVLDRGRLWVTTARGTVKARTWRRKPDAAGMVRLGDRAVVFRAHVRLHDVLDPTTWANSIRRAPSLARASARFTVKNARFFAGYARDAHRVPFGWSPPGRVVVSLDLHAGAVLDVAAGTVEERWGKMGSRIASRAAYRAAAPGWPALDAIPPAVRKALEGQTSGALSVGGAVLPVTLSPNAGLLATTPRSFLSLAGAGADAPAALVIDHASSWRASRMAGAMIRGPASIFVPGRLRSGSASLGRALPENAGDDVAAVRIDPRSAVWWSGWSSGTVMRP